MKIISMMTGLFNSFNFSCMIFSLNLFLFMFFIMLMPSSSFFLSRVFKMKHFLVYDSLNVMKKNISSSSIMGESMFLLCIFMIIVGFNIFSLFGYSFPLTAHFSWNMGLSIVVWMIPLLMTIFFNPFKMIKHCLPTGTPLMLIWFMFLIEFVSMTLRPLTLTVRLTANLFTGHLLISLLTNMLSMTIIFFLFPIMSIFLLFEMMVSFIQAYVFFILVMNYMKEML